MDQRLSLSYLYPHLTFGYEHPYWWMRKNNIYQNGCGVGRRYRRIIRIRWHPYSSGIEFKPPPRSAVLPSTYTWGELDAPSRRPRLRNTRPFHDSIRRIWKQRPGSEVGGMGESSGVWKQTTAHALIPLFWCTWHPLPSSSLSVRNPKGQKRAKWVW